MDAGKISQTLEDALQAKNYDSPEVRHDIAFHMTDWLSDLQEWHSFCESPESLEPDQISDLLIRFLVHVPNHLAAASRLMTGIPVTDIFDVGAVATDDED